MTTVDISFQVIFWFLPIPFMLLYYVKTKKLNFIYRLVTILVPLVVGTLLITNTWLGSFNPILTSFYIVAVFVGLLLFRKKYDFPQAASLVFNIVFLNLLYWELPTFIYTILYRGYVDQAISLHVLPIFSFYFLYTKLNFKLTKANILLLLYGFIFSTIVLYFLVYCKINIWEVSEYLGSMYWIKEITYSLMRTVCLIILYLIFYNCKIREKEK